MKWVTAYRSALHVHERRDETLFRPTPELPSSIASRAVHELLFDPVSQGMPPLFLGWMTARTVIAKESFQNLIWIDPAGTFYPPAAMGNAGPVQLDILRPSSKDLIWTAVECLRCKHVGAVVALLMHRPTPIEVRRLQLAAEHGGGVGILLRPNLVSAGSQIYAASTRWLVSPAPGERTIQRWRIQQIHGHGRRTHSSFLLEKHRASGQANFVYPSAAVVHYPILPAAS